MTAEQKLALDELRMLVRFVRDQCERPSAADSAFKALKVLERGLPK